MEHLPQHLSVPTNPSHGRNLTDLEEIIPSAVLSPQGSTESDTEKAETDLLDVVPLQVVPSPATVVINETSSEGSGVISRCVAGDGGGCF